VPRAALNREAEYFGKLQNFTDSKILEHQISLC